MYAISFELNTKKLKNCYDGPFDKAYYEIRMIMDECGFDWTRDELYILKSNKNTLVYVYKAIHALSQIPWFKESVIGVIAYKVEDWTDFTDIVKSNEQ